MTERIYLDNAATTPIDPLVVDAMLPYITNHFGNPSSIYSYGRETRLAIENSRKTVARLLGAHPAEIFFTSGGTESSNTAIQAAVYNLDCKTIISSAIEHHATLHSVTHAARQCRVNLEYVSVDEMGHIRLDHLEELLKKAGHKCLVTLMHANNEIGNLLNLEKTGELCMKYSAIFHSDTVQTVGHYPFELRKTPVHFITGASHKFHGPKGVGILYINENIKIDPLLHGGSQERNMRAGTENVYGIVGFAKALELASERYETDKQHILHLKQYMKQALQQFEQVGFNGDIDGNSLYTVLSVRFPKTEKSEMLLFSLDMNHICASGGSACTSGADAGSHVIRAINNDPNFITVRFSFSRNNTTAEIDKVIAVLKNIL